MSNKINITNVDIEIAEELLLKGFGKFDEERRNAIKNLENVDIMACAGSGKTTMMCAKVDILCKKQPFNNKKGICVLSYTNIAIEEIKKKLGNNHKIFSYPNYCETIQKFVGEYIFKSWYYYEYRRKISNIDDEICENTLKKNIKKKDYKKVQYLDRLSFNFNEVNTDGINVYYNSEVIDKMKPIGKLKKETWEQYKRIIKETKLELIAKGIFNYKDIFFISKEYIKKNKKIKEYLEHRFEYVIIDEMQDVRDWEMEILNDVFSDIVVQRIGDTNQQIYEGDGWNPTQYITIKKSLRNSVNIAEFSGKFEIKTTNMIGNMDNDLKVKFIVFNDSNIKLVKNTFAKEILKEGLEAPIGKIKIIGAVTNYNENNITLQDYFDNYNNASKDISRLDKILKKNLLHNTIYKAMIDTVYETLRYVDSNNFTGINRKQHFIEKINEEEFQIEEIKEKIFKKLKIDASYKNIYLMEKNLILIILDKLILDKSYLESILKIFFEESESTGNAKENIWQYEEDDKQIEIEYGSIHSVKGETHIATMVVETFYYKYDIEYALEKYVFGSGNMGKRLVGCLRKLYTGFTRPSNMLCVALREDTYKKFEKEIKEKLDVEVIHV